MKRNASNHLVNRYIAVSLAIAILGGATYFAFTNQQSIPDVAASPNANSHRTEESRFSFAGAPEWRKGPSNKTSMALFHGHDCFVSAEYKPGTVEVSAELEKIKTSLTDMGYTVTTGVTLTNTLQTDQGSKEYELHQYSVTGAGSAGQVKGGQEYGYLQLSDGYVQIEGHCDSADQLPSTIPALLAIKFNIVD
jgi:hypothetical protein